MLCLLAPLVVSAASPTTGAPIPPATELAIEVAEAVGARIAKLAIDADPSVTADEVALIKTALERTSLFVVSDMPDVQARLGLVRVDPTVLLATVTGANGNRLWVGRIDWPSADQTVEVPRDEDEHQAARLAYRRERLQIAPARASMAPPPIIMYSWGSRSFGTPRPWGWHLETVGPTVDNPPDWVILRGGAETLGDADFARLLGNQALLNRVEEAHFWPQIYWAVGFGSGALAGAGAGAFLIREGHRDQRALGVSLVTVGVLSGVLAMMFPTAGPRHVMSAGEVQMRIDEYNEALRHKYRLSPAEVERLSD